MIASPFRMRAARALTSIVCLTLAVPDLASGQAAAGAQGATSGEPAATAAAPDPGLSGTYEGRATLTNDWPGLDCRYTSSEPTAVRLALLGSAGQLRGSVAIDISAPAGSRCPALRKRYVIESVSEGPGTLAFSDSGGHEWTLAVREQGRSLQGLLVWRQGGPEVPLAESFRTRSGARPLTRLSGEVVLNRLVETAAPAPPAARPKAGAGTHAKNVALIVGANVVGLAAIYGANRLGKGSSTGGVVTCSPRVCRVAGPNQQCFCEPTTVTTGAACPTGTAGLLVGATGCDKNNPCQAGYSCNIENNVGKCQDADGLCQY